MNDDMTERQNKRLQTRIQLTNTMDRYSPSPELRSPSPTFSQSSVQLDDDSSESEAGDVTVPPGEHTASPGPSAPAAEPSDTVTCLWEDCGHVFSHLPTLIEHIHSGQCSHSKVWIQLTTWLTAHIGVHKSNYTCEWATCTRRGLAQTSRFALISHIRSHTGEKPFICSRPGQFPSDIILHLESTRVT